jgi:hypothetical protein
MKFLLVMIVVVSRVVRNFSFENSQFQCLVTFCVGKPPVDPLVTVGYITALEGSCESQLHSICMS